MGRSPHLLYRIVCVPGSNPGSTSGKGEAPLDRLQLKQIFIRKIRKQCETFQKDGLYLDIDDVVINGKLKGRSLGPGVRLCDAVAADEIGRMAPFLCKIPIFTFGPWRCTIAHVTWVILGVFR